MSDVMPAGNQKARCVVYDRFGEAEVLHTVPMTVPEPGTGEVCVQVAGAGLNPIDWKTRKGLGFAARQIEDTLPWTPGYDMAGEVIAVGSEVTTFKTGDRVMGMIGFPSAGGSYANYAIARSDELVMVPDDLDLVDAGALPLAALTAWQALFEVGKLEPEQKVLILAGSGGVGHFAVQFAFAHGAHVIATTSERNTDFVDKLGAHEIIDYHTTNVEEECFGLDLVLDLIGGETGKRALRTLGEKGTLVTVPTVTADDIISAAESMGLRAHGLTVRPDVYHLEEIVELIEDGDVRIHIDQRYSLDAAVEAHQTLEAGHVRGKLVFDCRPS